ncbi:threonine synthase [Deinococcus ruber]|uniref:Threonine synthase n=1 Tax=Deinococcus ruber TaxID=1848197 RepID=A0A918F1G2_9DEIO|nr:threonine synthase [Deinococcus ruber]GGQ96353.1 threonine synthase [Deinococcus ruber]
MQYISTRGGIAPVGFIQAVLMGLADDGGLLVPEHLPQLSAATLEQWRTLSYQELTLELLTLFAGDELPRADLRDIVQRSYATFRHPDVTPVHRLQDDLYVLELFHGPTFAFKDVALQLLGNMYAYISQQTGSIIHILGATSGDTGASAIAGVSGKPGVRICILYPHGRVSEVQQLQMTTIADENVLNLAIEGTFDDAQRIIKEIFGDAAFKQRYHLRAINSINILRILAQITYYFYAYFRVSEQQPGRSISFSVPTGNFGDIFAGYLAKQMGLPIHRLIVATNENDILVRFVQDGVYRPEAFRSTHSPSMDIQVASNFERYLYYLYGENAAKVKELMAEFRANGLISVPQADLERVRADFAARSVENATCLTTISQVYAGSGYLLDPHTACGVAAADAEALGDITIALATAHPAKFNEAIALSGLEQSFPDEIQALFGKPQRQQVVPATSEAVEQHLVEFFGAASGVLPAPEDVLETLT